MALIKSQVITSASGSVGGMTYSRNRSGIYLRARAVPVNPSTTYQQVVRNAQSTLSQRWQTTLTEGQRQSWTDYAANVLRKNKLGDTINIGGLPMYVRCNVPRIQAGLAIIDDGPVIYTVGDSGTLAAVQTTETDEMDVTVTNVTLTATDYILVYTSRPMSPAINYWQGPTRYAIRTPGGVGPYEVTLQIPLLPYPWEPGVQGRVRQRISYADGRLSDANETSLIVGPFDA